MSHLLMFSLLLVFTTLIASSQSAHLNSCLPMDPVPLPPCLLNTTTTSSSFKELFHQKMKLHQQTEQLLADYKIRQVEKRLQVAAVQKQPKAVVSKQSKAVVETLPLSTVILVIIGTTWYFAGLFFAVAIWTHLIQMELIIMEEEMAREEWIEAGSEDDEEDDTD